MYWIGLLRGGGQIIKVWEVKHIRRRMLISASVRMMGTDCLLSNKSPHRKQTKVVEADARATQPGFRLSPLFNEGGGLYRNDPRLFKSNHPTFDFKERRA